MNNSDGGKEHLIDACLLSVIHGYSRDLKVGKQLPKVYLPTPERWKDSSLTQNTALSDLNSVYSGSLISTDFNC